MRAKVSFNTLILTYIHPVDSVLSPSKATFCYPILPEENIIFKGKNILQWHFQASDWREIDL